MFLRLMISSALLIMVIISSCEVINSSSGEEAEVVHRGNDILIRDNTGKEWDVTHAVEKYGFVATQFQYGLGPFAIRPILEPEMVGPGESGYPSKNNDLLVIGTTLNKESRAYPLDVLNRHEIADEIFGEQYVAVAY
jgi:hypothetical protein